MANRFKRRALSRTLRSRAIGTPSVTKLHLTPNQACANDFCRHDADAGVSRHNDRHNNGGCETRTDLDGLRAAGATSQRTSSRPLATITIVPSAFRGVPVFAYASIGISMAIPIT